MNKQKKRRYCRLINLVHILFNRADERIMSPDFLNNRIEELRSDGGVVAAS